MSVRVGAKKYIYIYICIYIYIHNWYIIIAEAHITLQGRGTREEEKAKPRAEKRREDQAKRRGDRSRTKVSGQKCPDKRVRTNVSNNSSCGDGDGGNIHLAGLLFQSRLRML